MRLYFIPLLSSGVRGGLPTQFEKELILIGVNTWLKMSHIKG